ncbi:unnamed protein product [Protopolystoma xenopodis]|uniref:Uncharacterized protein n=1 Tax=Protopolystoma xenopodis TaxID=117903 RepID=A0A3S5CGR3_9PLAT|nr:unnamed protein product [Protopolystoma xenopodis]
MAKLTDDADNDAGETFENVSSALRTCSDDVCRGGTDEILVQFLHGRQLLLGTIEQSSLRGNPPSVSGRLVISQSEPNESETGLKRRWCDNVCVDAAGSKCQGGTTKWAINTWSLTALNTTVRESAHTLADDQTDKIRRATGQTTAPARPVPRSTVPDSFGSVLTHSIPRLRTRRFDTAAI